MFCVGMNFFVFLKQTRKTSQESNDPLSPTKFMRESEFEVNPNYNVYRESDVNADTNAYRATLYGMPTLRGSGKPRTNSSASTNLSYDEFGDEKQDESVMYQLSQETRQSLMVAGTRNSVSLVDSNPGSQRDSRYSRNSEYRSSQANRYSEAKSADNSPRNSVIQMTTLSSKRQQVDLNLSTDDYPARSYKLKSLVEKGILGENDDVYESDILVSPLSPDNIYNNPYADNDNLVSTRSSESLTSASKKRISSKSFQGVRDSHIISDDEVLTNLGFDNIPEVYKPYRIGKLTDPFADDDEVHSNNPEIKAADMPELTLPVSSDPPLDGSSKSESDAASARDPDSSRATVAELRHQLQDTLSTVYSGEELPAVYKPYRLGKISDPFADDEKDK